MTLELGAGPRDYPELDIIPQCRTIGWLWEMGHLGLLSPPGEVYGERLVFLGSFLIYYEQYNKIFVEKPGFGLTSST